METLGDALPKEIERVQELRKDFLDPIMKGAGDFAAALMLHAIEKAQKAINEGDTVAMIAAYQDLQGFTG